MTDREALLFAFGALRAVAAGAGTVPGARAVAAILERHLFPDPAAAPAKDPEPLEPFEDPLENELPF